MAQADPRIKKLKIQTGVVKRQVEFLLLLMKVRFSVVSGSFETGSLGKPPNLLSVSTFCSYKLCFRSVGALTYQCETSRTAKYPPLPRGVTNSFKTELIVIHHMHVDDVQSNKLSQKRLKELSFRG